MRQRSFAILVAAVAFLLAGSVGVYAYDSAHENQIADGVKAGGVDIGIPFRGDLLVLQKRDGRAAIDGPHILAV